MFAYKLVVFCVDKYGGNGRKAFYRFHSVLAKAFGLVMFAQAKELPVAVQKLVDVIAALGQYDAEIPFLDIHFMGMNAVHRADVGGVFFARQKAFAVVCKQFKEINLVTIG